MRISNRTKHAPRPLRLLIAWPDETAVVLTRQLRALRYDGAIDYEVLMPDTVLRARPGYYHVLIVSPVLLVKLTESEQARIGRIADLLLLASDTLSNAIPTDRLNVAPAVIAWQTAPELGSVCHFIAQLCTNLTDGYDLPAAITNSCDHAKVSTPLLICADSAIWLKGKSSPVRRVKQSGQSATQSAGINVSFGATQFGDHYHVGDVGRISVQSDGETHVSPGGDVGSIKAQPPTQHTCTKCTQINTVGSRFCKKCGNALASA